VDRAIALATESLEIVRQRGNPAFQVRHRNLDH
jgi:hypothetical protein